MIVRWFVMFCWMFGVMYQVIKYVFLTLTESEYSKASLMFRITWRQSRAASHSFTRPPGSQHKRQVRLLRLRELVNFCLCQPVSLLTSLLWCVEPAGTQAAAVGLTD